MTDWYQLNLYITVNQLALLLNQKDFTICRMESIQVHISAVGTSSKVSSSELLLN